MKIIVPIKQVPETSNVSMDPETGTMIRDGVESIINPLDLYAIEESVKLKEEHGGEILVISMGPSKAEMAIREAISMGCDDGILLSNKEFAGSDTLATSYTLSQSIKKFNPYDLIICGERATDGDTGQVGPGIAAWLDIPFTTYVSKIKEVNENSMIVQRMVETGYEILEIETPCLLTVVKEINYPRLPSMRGKLLAKKKEIKTWGPDDIEAKRDYIGLEGSPTRVVKISKPKVSRGGEILMPKNESELDKAVDGLIEYLQKKEII